MTTHSNVLHGKQIEEIINCAIASARLSRIPLSVILVSLSGAGKSLLLNAYTGIPGIHRTDSFTASGIYTLCRDDNKNQLRHILVSDLNIPLSRKSSTVTMLIGTLIGLMSEGMVRVDDGRIDGKALPHNPVGLLSAMTIDEFTRQSRLMHRVGLIRRLMPIFYEYKTTSEMDILKYYAENGHHINDTFRVQLSELRMTKDHDEKTIVIKWPQNLKQTVIPLGMKLAENLRYMPSTNVNGKRKIVQGSRIMPVSTQITIQKLCEARAFLNQRGTVNESDITFAGNVCDFTQYGKPILL
jgi:hypothetical protein